MEIEMEMEMEMEMEKTGHNSRLAAVRPVFTTAQNDQTS